MPWGCRTHCAMSQIQYSIVIPVFNSSRIVAETVRQTMEHCRVASLSFEIILVNDGSSDSSWQIIKDLARQHTEVRAVNLLRNYGQHNANMCGFRQARGQFVITMDDDLQNPPSEIAKLISKAAGGYDLVIGKFRHKRHPFHRRLGSLVIGVINRRIFGTPSEITLTNFRLISREVVDRICSYRTSSPYIPGLVVMFAHDIANVEVEHHARAEGGSGYSILRLLRLVSTILFNYSSLPLRLMSQIGIAVSIISLGLGAWFLIRAWLDDYSVPGWASIMVLLSVFNGIVLAILGMMGEYLVRLINQSSFPESYVIKEIAE